MTQLLTSGIRPLLMLGALALAAYVWLFDSPYDLRVMTVAGVYVIVVLGFQFIFGHSGALALTQGTFFGLGAYVTGILGAKLGWSFPATFPLSMLVPVLLAVLVAAPVLRLESHYFALATLGIGQVMLLVAIKWEPLTGGANGLPGVPGIELFGIAIRRGWPALMFVWGIAAVALALALQITRGGLGLQFHVARAAPLAAASLGIDAALLRFQAFLLAAVFAGAAGALYVHTLRVISPEVLDFHIMVTCLTMTVVGGATHVGGAVFAAVLLVHLPEWLRFLDRGYLIAYGLLLLAAIIVAPAGLTGAMARLRQRLAPEPLPPPPPTRPLAATVATVDTALVVEAVSKRFGGVNALSRVSLAVAPGELLGLIGPNGSGKTTLVNVVSGAYRQDDGRVLLGGRDISRIPAHARARLGIARTFQNLALADQMSALDNVAVARLARGGFGLGGALAAGWTDRALAMARAEAAGLLESLGVGAEAMRPCGGLAYGLKRRVEIARALALEPRVLLLDEPAAGLNPAEQADLARRLRRLAGGGLAVIVIEHNMPFLMPLVDRVVCLDHGEVIATGAPEAIRHDAKVIEAYLGVTPP
jgi:branched-chain amino acid transport system permease protein